MSLATQHPLSAEACRLTGVHVAYDGVAALAGVDLRIGAGERVALVGPSGAGKTTLLKTIAGMVPATAGEVSLHGRSVASLRPGRELTELVGMVQQRLDLIPQLSVKHNVQAGLLGRWGLVRSLAALVLPVEVPAAREAVRRVGIEGKFSQRVARLSGGEQQRVALARLLIQDPAVILADEPVSSLDPARAEDLLALLADLAGEAGKTLVASLHVPDLALRHFERIVGLRAGHVAFDLPAGEVTREHLEGLYRLLAPVDGSGPASA